MPAACSGPGLAVLGERCLGSRPDAKGKSRQGPGGSENEQKTAPNKTPSSGPSPRPHLPAPCQPGQRGHQEALARVRSHVVALERSTAAPPGAGGGVGGGGLRQAPPGARCPDASLSLSASSQPPKRIGSARCQRAAPCPRHSQAPGQLAPDPETGTLARLPSPVLLAGGRARDPEDSPWASLAAVNGLHAAWLSEKEKNRPSDPNWWKRF